MFALEKIIVNLCKAVPFLNNMPAQECKKHELNIILFKNMNIFN